MALHVQEQHTPFFILCLQNDCATFSHSRTWPHPLEVHPLEVLLDGLHKHCLYQTNTGRCPDFAASGRQGSTPLRAQEWTLKKTTVLNNSLKCTSDKSFMFFVLRFSNFYGSFYQLWSITDKRYHTLANVVNKTVHCYWKTTKLRNNI